MSEHTKEPWSIFTPDDFVAGKLPTLGINGANGEAVVWYADIPDSGIYNDDDARRIVACVNACAGIPTDDLEASPNMGLFHLAEFANEMVIQRDELLEALKVALAYLPIGSEQYEKTKTAIAKVK